MAKLLIVDDNEQILQILSRYTQAQGHQAVLARTGPQALEAFTAQEPDLVLLDVMLPGMDGFAVCREIRARSLTPVIMITARSDDEDRILGLDTGADDYVVKPFSPGEVMARVRAVLRRVPPPAQADGMLAELQQLQTVVQDLVTLARIRAPGYSVERKVCSLQEILRDVGRSLASLASRQGVTFSLELPQTASPQDMVRTNYDRLRQLVMILGENAIKYTRPGGCAGLRLEWTAQGPAVLVWDQGTGIPPEDQERIFRPFFRSSKQAGSIPGEGLGLAIARELCTLLGVEVRLEHTGPEGSTFSLHPPAAG